MSDAGEFYARRDRRSLEVGAREAALEKPVAIVVERETASTLAGQIAVLASLNMLARVHRRIALDCPDTKLVKPTPFTTSPSLRGAAQELLRCIDPFLDLSLDVADAEVALVIGPTAAPVRAWHVGADGATAHLSDAPQPFNSSDVTALGAGMAACLGASALFKFVHDMPVVTGSVSSWPVSEVNKRTAPTSLPPLDLGDVALIGAGAVGSSLAYWLRVISGTPRGRWWVVDHDQVELHNTNRGLGMLPAHSGWPIGAAQCKAKLAAELIGASAVCSTYEDWIERAPIRFDLVIPLANGPGVRAAINNYAAPILVHATTTRQWRAILHRHIVGRDECIECRLPDDGVPAFACSSGTLPQREGAHGDAALPFVSAAAGLLLLAGLYQLQLGELQRGDENMWSLLLNSCHRLVQTGAAPRGAGCAHGVSPSTLVRLVAGGRFAGIVPR